LPPAQSYFGVSDLNERAIDVVFSRVDKPIADGRKAARVKERKQRSIKKFQEEIR
jgi:hypothetical protein